MKTKVCGKCNKRKLIDKFAIRNKKTGLRQWWCIKCRSDYDKKRYKNKNGKEKQRLKDKNKKTAKRNSLFLYNYLKENPCVNCNEDDPIVLCFDHLDANTKHDNVANMVSGYYSIKRIQEEIDKCQVLCMNCHTRKTAVDQSWKFLEFNNGV